MNGPRLRAFGPTGTDLPLVGQGTWKMEDDATAVDALRHGLDLGLRIVDTAEMYADGRAEELVGEALEGRRDDAYLVSKVLPSHASRTGTLQACERSLGRLGTDHLDLYLLHWPGEHPLEDTLAGFEQLVDEGKILAWGVSNFDVDELEQLLALAGPGRLACNQVLYHLRERSIEHSLLPFCAERGIAVMAYSPFGQGDLPWAGAVPVVRDLARARGVDPSAIALAFLVHEAPVFAIPKASRLEHVECNAAATGLRLEADEWALMDAAFPRGERGRGLPML